MPKHFDQAPEFTIDTYKADIIAEATAAAGVTVDGVLLKDSQVTTDVILEKSSATGVTIDGTLLKDGGAVLTGALLTDTISEKTSTNGVTIDGVLVKDTAVLGRTHILALSVNGAITVPAYNIHYFLTKAGVAAMTIVDPTATVHDGVTLTFIAATANAHTVDNSAGSGFFSSGGASKDVATFGGAIGDGFSIIAYQGKWYIDPRGVTNVTLA